MTQKLLSLTKVINGLKDSHPDLNYDLLPQLNINLDKSCIDKSEELKDLKDAVKCLKFPILDPIKIVIEKLIEEKAKLPKTTPRIERLIQILEQSGGEGSSKSESEIMEVDPETSSKVVTPKKNKKLKNQILEKCVKRPTKKPKLTHDPADMIASQESHLIFNNSIKWWRPFNMLDDGRYDPLCFDGKECKKETNQWSHEKEIACKQLVKSKCCFRMNIVAYLKFLDRMRDSNANFWPIPKCSCSQDKPDSKPKIAIRGSSPKTENFNLWYYCEECRTTFYFNDYEKKINKVLKSQPKLIQEEEEEVDSDIEDAAHTEGKEEESSSSSDEE